MYSRMDTRRSFPVRESSWKVANKHGKIRQSGLPFSCSASLPQTAADTASNDEILMSALPSALKFAISGDALFYHGENCLKHLE